MELPSQVIHPLGLAGFALALVFGLVAKVAKKPPAWLMPSAIGLAAASVVGGLWIEHSKTPDPGVARTPIDHSASAPSQSASANDINAVVPGDCNIVAAGGNVNIGGNVSTNCKEGLAASAPSRAASQ